MLSPWFASRTFKRLVIRNDVLTRWHCCPQSEAIRQCPPFNIELFSSVNSRFLGIIEYDVCFRLSKVNSLSKNHDDRFYSFFSLVFYMATPPVKRPRLVLKMFGYESSSPFTPTQSSDEEIDEGERHMNVRRHDIVIHNWVSVSNTTTPLTSSSLRSSRGDCYRRGITRYSYDRVK